MVREVSGQVTGPLGQNKEVKLYSQFDEKPLKEFRQRKKIILNFKKIPLTIV